VGSSSFEREVWVSNLQASCDSASWLAWNRDGGTGNLWKTRMLGMLVRSAIEPLAQRFDHFNVSLTIPTVLASVALSQKSPIPKHHLLISHQRHQSARPACKPLASSPSNTIQKTHKETRIEQFHNHAGGSHSHSPSHRTSCAIAASSNHSDFTTRATRPCFSASARKALKSLTSASLSPATR